MQLMDKGSIIIRNARVNNLKNISLSIERGKLVVVTGVSGSGKSSLAFDTLFAEGQRRFAQSMSSYARQFLGRMSKPDVDYVEGIPPAVAIEQKVNVRNPRSTVATSTEIYDYLRLIFARIGRTYSPISGEEVKSDSVSSVIAWMEERVNGDNPAYILFLPEWGDTPVAELLRFKEEGYSRVWTTSGMSRIDDVLQSGARDWEEQTFILIDRFSSLEDRTRLMSSLNDAFRSGNGVMYIAQGAELNRFSQLFEKDGIVFEKPNDYMFSFNSPIGACKECGGLGKVMGISEDLVVPDKTKSIYDGAIACWRGEKVQ